MQQKELVITLSRTNPPFSYLGPNGQPQGYIIDLWRSYSNITGTPVSFKLTTWAHSINLVKTGEAHVHGGLLRTPERDQYLEYGQVITTVASDLFVHRNLKDNNYTDFPVAVIKDSHLEKILYEKKPDRYLLHFDHMQNIVQAASKGLVKVIAGQTPSTLYYLRKAGLDDDFVQQESLSVKKLYFAVAKDNNKLLSDITKGWSQMDKSLLKHIHDVWFIKDAPMPKWVLPVTIATVMILITALMLRRMLR